MTVEMSPEWIRLWELLVRLHGGNRAHVQAAGAPRAASDAAENLWLRQAPETEDTRELRRQLQHLHDKGFFDVLGGPTK